MAAAAAAAASFLGAVPPDHDFSLQNLPYGVFSTPHTQPRCGAAIGDWVVDLSVLADEGIFGPE
jgi:fumarylacetoacetase